MGDYNLDALGWYQFERLTQALLRAAYGANLQAWGGSGDLGRDAYSDGPLRYPDPDRSEEGPFVFQAKFVAGANAPGAKPGPPLLKAVRSERDRIRDRIAQKQWAPARFYTLLTNVPLNKELRDAVSTAMHEVLPDCMVSTLGDADLAASLDDNPRIRTSYPQILGLRDLETLLDRVIAPDVRSRSNLVLATTAKLAQVFVPTSAYNDALLRLNEHGFAVLTGPPEVGKTAAARMIALARYANGWEAYETRKPEDVLALYRKDAQQIFIADDAFGSTEYRPELGSAWGDHLEQLIELTDSSHAIIWTSRPGPLREALRRIRRQGSAERFPDPSQVQVDSSHLSVAEKAQMLYRHAKAADLDEVSRDVVRRWARRIVNSTYFTPLRVARFVKDSLPQVASSPESEQAELIASAIETSIKEPTEPLRQSFEMLNEEHRAVLLALLNFTELPVALDSVQERVRDYLPSVPSRPVAVLAKDLDEHFINISESEWQ